MWLKQVINYYEKNLEPHENYDVKENLSAMQTTNLAGSKSSDLL